MLTKELNLIPTFSEGEGHQRTALRAVIDLLTSKELDDEECDPEFRRFAPRRGGRNEVHQGTEVGNTIIQLTIKITYE